MTRPLLIAKALKVCHAHNMKKKIHRRSFFIIEKIQIGLILQARSYCLSCLANTSDDELNKRTKRDVFLKL